MILYDETGLNPLPAGIQVFIYPATGPQTLVASGWTQPGGVVPFTLSNAVNYAGIFLGRQAPPNQVVVGGATFACQGYRSPSLSVAGYVAEQATQLLPGGWFGETATVAGGNTFPVLQGNAALLLVPGVDDVTGLTLNGGTADIVAPFANQLVAGTGTFTPA